MVSIPLQAEAKALIDDESQKKERRRVDKFMTLQVQQISATQQQAGPGLDLSCA